MNWRNVGVKDTGMENVRPQLLIFWHKSIVVNYVKISDLLIKNYFA